MIKVCSDCHSWFLENSLLKNRSETMTMMLSRDDPANADPKSHPHPVAIMSEIELLEGTLHDTLSRIVRIWFLPSGCSMRHNSVMS